jgi:hypothetical protein
MRVRTVICRSRRLRSAVCDIHHLLLRQRKLALRNCDSENLTFLYTVRSESRFAIRPRCVDLVVSIEFADEVLCCFTVFSY